MSGEKTLAAKGTLYNGVLINQVGEKKFVIIEESGKEYEFVSLSEAQTFVDLYMMLTRVLDGRVQANISWT